MKTQLKKIPKGFTLVEILIVVVIIGLLLGIGLPNLMAARKKSIVNTAKASMKQLGGAVAQARMDSTFTINNSNVLDSIVPDYLKVWPSPSGGTLDTEFDNGSNHISFTPNDPGINGGNPFTIFDTVTF